MNFMTKFVNRPAKMMFSGALHPFGYDIQMRSMIPELLWLGLPDRKFRTVLDIGACRGGFAESILLPRFKQAVIHCFEPTPDGFAVLKGRADASRGRIVAHNFGLGEEPGRLAFNLASNALPASSLLAGTARNAEAFPETAETRKIEVEIRRLDDVALDLELDDEILVKIDVQGFEDRVIRGGLETLTRATACVVEIQSAELYEGQPDFHDIYTLLREIDFHFEGCLQQHAAPDGSVLYYDAVFLKT